jgi:hypothetical protein
VKRIAAILFAATALSSFPLYAQNQAANAVNPNDPAVKAAIDQAGQAAQRWLALFDTNNFDACWNALAPAARDQIGKADFSGSLAAVREQYGAAKSRRASKVTFTHKLPGAPDGDYVVLQYETDFANNAHAVETVVPMRTTDGWKVSGYFVR